MKVLYSFLAVSTVMLFGSLYSMEMGFHHLPETDEKARSLCLRNETGDKIEIFYKYVGQSNPE